MKKLVLCRQRDDTPYGAQGQGGGKAAGDRSWFVVRGSSLESSFYRGDAEGAEVGKADGRGQRAERRL